MTWSGGTYRKGNYSTNGWTGDASLGIGIEAGRHDTQDDDFMNGINQCLNKDGSNAATGNLNLGSNKLTNVANATNPADAMAYGQIRNGTPLYMDTTNNRLGINTITPIAPLDIAKSSSGIDNVTTKYEAGAQGSIIHFRKSKNNTIGNNTIVVSDDALGELYFLGANGSDFTAAASIIARVDGTPGATNDMPGRLIFSTTADGSGSPTERMRINSNGDVGVGFAATSGNRVQIQGADTTGTANSLIVQNSAAAVTLQIRNDGLVNTGNAALSPYNLTTAAAANMVVGSGGNLNRSTSSLKYKTDVNDSVHGLAEVLQLRSVTYKGKNDGETIFGGLIAEEVDAIGLTEFVQYADDETPDALAYGNMVSLAFKAIQELNAKVEALEARVAELEA